MSETLTVLVMDTLHDVTMDTIFDAAERFDPLVRDLRAITAEFGSGTSADMAFQLHGSWGAHPRPREAVILDFLDRLPGGMTGREIAAGLEGR
ncbi:hypothetical protein AA12717_0370 [Gluconacetobacter sacchari DSM 12717]|uniref:Uncharacterized protein n=2 Tax=Gluconacetobacter sacchari TaxID=92759 RepID=A0A7W4IC14_9PROT|nr:hypothetical protein [Gluconacetobacter sacchari]MBB2160113.1 hypothetical protein [Gluconacetobacter sacchari]GBQ19845.1 hypothetical protein AA12717_0370 [Gluconacetobacter sacchari DSM 12717]